MWDLNRNPSEGDLSAISCSLEIMTMPALGADDAEASKGEDKAKVGCRSITQDAFTMEVAKTP